MEIKKINIKSIFCVLFVIFASFCSISSCFLNFYNFNLKISSAFCENIEINKNNFGDIMNNITFSYCGNIYKVNDLKYNYNKTKVQNKILKDFEQRKIALNFAIKNGIEIEKAFLYAFPEIERTVAEIEEKNLILPQNAKLSVIENTAKLMIINSKNGSKIAKNELFYEILNNFNGGFAKNNFEIKSQIINPQILTDDVKFYSNLRGGFVTSFEASSAARKNNIKNALKQFDGKVLNPGEMLSFNSQTGVRNEDSGYQKAKIIKNGVFIEEYGGGVCQVSTTLYNAALMAGLEIVEVHAHSLPVSYIEPCFDAMVNMGSSDLVIRNNLEYPVIIATSSENNQCKVNIYGQENEFKILRKSEKIEDIAEKEKIYTTDYEKYGFSEPLKQDEKIILGHAKPGYKARGWIEYYKDDVLIKTNSVRNETYNSTCEVVLVGE